MLRALALSMLNVKFIAFSTLNTKNHSSSSVPKAKNIWHELQHSSVNRRVQKKMQKFLNIFLVNFLSRNNKVLIHLSLTHSFSLLFFSFASSLIHSLIFRFVSSSLLCLSQSKAWVLLSLSLSHIYLGLWSRWMWSLGWFWVLLDLLFGLCWSRWLGWLILVVGWVWLGSIKNKFDIFFPFFIFIFISFLQ